MFKIIRTDVNGNRTIVHTSETREKAETMATRFAFNDDTKGNVYSVEAE